MANACRDRIHNGGDTNYHIFLNSIEDINKIIIGAEVLTPDNTKIVCSTSSDEELLPGFPVGNAGDAAKLINFYTSTCFEGQDILDEDGESIIVSDGWKKHTMVDITTSFIQIAGRIRNSKYRNRVTQILSLSRFKTAISAEQYEREVMEELDKMRTYVDWMNACPADLIESFLKQIPYMRVPYVQTRNNRIVLDKNLAYQDIVNYKIVHHDYCSCVNMEATMADNGVTINSFVSEHISGTIKVEPKKKRASFKEMFNLYSQIKESNKYSLVEDERLVEIRTKRPLVIEAYNKLGPEKVKAMKYHIGNIRNALTKMTNAKEDYKIVEIVSRSLPMMQ